MPKELYHFTRKKRGNATSASHVASDLPLFDLREAPASEKKIKPGLKVEKAA